jgi:hypothetical protein
MYQDIQAGRHAAMSRVVLQILLTDSDPNVNLWELTEAAPPLEAAHVSGERTVKRTAVMPNHRALRKRC